MRSIPDEFLGALLGAWVGVTTKIWNEPFLKMFLFVAGLAFIAILLGIVSSTLGKAWRISALALLLTVAALIGVAFTYVPELTIFYDKNQVGFFYVLLGGWLTVGLVTAFLERFTPKPTIEIPSGLVIKY